MISPFTMDSRNGKFYIMSTSDVTKIVSNLIEKGSYVFLHNILMGLSSSEYIIYLAKNYDMNFSTKGYVITYSFNKQSECETIVEELNKRANIHLQIRK